MYHPRTRTPRAARLPAALPLPFSLRRRAGGTSLASRGRTGGAELVLRRRTGGAESSAAQRINAWQVYSAIASALSRSRP